MGFSKVWATIDGKEGSPKAKKAAELRKRPTTVRAEVEKLALPADRTKKNGGTE